MDLVISKWSKKDYKDFLTYLESIKNLKRSEFSKKIINDEDDKLIFYGLTTPEIQNITKQILKGDYIGFLELNTFKSYEEKALYGSIIISLKLDFNETVEEIYKFIPIISNWALVDMSAGQFKALKDDLPNTFELVKGMLKSINPWEIRYGIIMMLSYFLNDEYIDQVLELSKQIDNEHYYVKMGNAWLLSTAYVKYPKKTLKLLKSNKLDKWTHNKAIQKIRESLRVSKDDKTYLNTLKRK